MKVDKENVERVARQAILSLQNIPEGIVLEEVWTAMEETIEEVAQLDFLTFSAIRRAAIARFNRRITALKTQST